MTSDLALHGLSVFYKMTQILYKFISRHVQFSLRYKAVILILLFARCVLMHPFCMEILHLIPVLRHIVIILVNFVIISLITVSLRKRDMVDLLILYYCLYVCVIVVFCLFLGCHDYVSDL